MFRFQYPFALLLLLFVPAMAWWHARRERARTGALRFSSLALVSGIEPSARLNFRHAVIVLRLLAVLLCVLALARPQWGESGEEVTTHGVDIMLLLDASGSMKAEDFKPENRLGVCKKVLADFIQGRKHDRLGLVVFAANAFTLCPLTADYDLLVDAIRSVDFSTVDEDGTAIGNAVAMAVNRLRESKAKSRIIILLTDGANNRGEIDPATAAKAAAALGIRIYTVGAGKEGPVPYPVFHPFFGKQYQTIESDIDENALRAIATETNGRFFRAKDPKSLVDIYGQIDKLEKTEIKAQMFTTYTELFTWFAGLALFALLLELLLSNTLLRRIP
ncbi:MAG: VWA domain-containing protein [Fibrobacterota bacterium]